MTDTKKWRVEFNHRDGRSGEIEVITEIQKSVSFEYGNGKCGAVIVDGYPFVYDLRYSMEKDLHMVMLKEYFGNGLVKATEI